MKTFKERFLEKSVNEMIKQSGDTTKQYKKTIKEFVSEVNKISDIIKVRYNETSDEPFYTEKRDETYLSPSFICYFDLKDKYVSKIYKDQKGGAIIYIDDKFWKDVEKIAKKIFKDKDKIISIKDNGTSFWF